MRVSVDKCIRSSLSDSEARNIRRTPPRFVGNYTGNCLARRATVFPRKSAVFPSMRAWFGPFREADPRFSSEKQGFKALNNYLYNNYLYLGGTWAFLIQDSVREPISADDRITICTPGRIAGSSSGHRQGLSRGPSSLLKKAPRGTNCRLFSVSFPGFSTGC